MNHDDYMQLLEQSNIELFQMGSDVSIIDTCCSKGMDNGELIAGAFPDNMQETDPNLSNNLVFNPNIPGL